MINACCFFPSPPKLEVCWQGFPYRLHPDPWKLSAELQGMRLLIPLIVCREDQFRTLKVNGMDRGSKRKQRKLRQILPKRQKCPSASCSSRKNTWKKLLENTWPSKNTLILFHYTGWLIGFPPMACQLHPHEKPASRIPQKTNQQWCWSIASPHLW
jgi:hypothetical protein